MGAMLSRPTRQGFAGSDRSAWMYGTRPPRGEIVTYDPMRDGFRPWLTDSMSFQSLAARLKSADAGYVRDLLKINEEIETKDSHVQAMASGRRLALTGVPWTITPPDEEDISDGMTAAAEEAAQYCRETLRPMESFARHLEHMGSAIGPNLSETEIIWGITAPERFDEVPIDRLWIDYTKDRQILIETRDNQRVPATPGKFITHIPNWNAGSPFRRTITSAIAMLHLISQGSIKDWAVFAEVYGMPMRVAYHSAEAIKQNREIIEAGLQSLGTDAYAIIPDGTRIEFVETSARNSHPYGELVGKLEERVTILYLGQTLTTAVGDSGSRALGEVHEHVRKDLTRNDAAIEERTMRGQLLAPMVAYRFPGKNVPIPRFVRQFVEPKDTVRIGAALQTGAQLGLRIARDTAHTMLGIPEAPDDTPDDKLLKPPAVAAPTPFGLGV